MTDLYLTFIKLDLVPGCSIETVNSRYRLLASLLHPDQLTGELKKANADLEMKALNNRRDLIVGHLKSATHRVTGPCECRQPSDAVTGSNNKASKATAGSAGATEGDAGARRSSSADGNVNNGSDTGKRTSADKPTSINPTPPGSSASGNSRETSESTTKASRATPDLSTVGDDPLRRARLIRSGRWPRDAKPGYESSPRSLDRHPDYPVDEQS